MGNFWLKFKVWTKVTLFALMLLYLLTFVIKNSEEEATMWFWFGNASLVKTSVLKLVFFTLLLGVIGTLLVRTTFVTLRQVRELQQRTRTERAERELNDMRTKAARLRARAEGAPGDETAVG